MSNIKQKFEKEFQSCIKDIQEALVDENGNWNIVGTLNRYGLIHPIPHDTKVISKNLESQVFPILKKFADEYGYELILPKHQNHYPDATLRNIQDPSILFAVDLKTTYRLADKPTECNGLTLGSHGTYFHDRKGTKNITFPYGDYTGHYSLVIVYDRIDVEIDETKAYSIQDVPTPISNFDVFLSEKWKIASDKRGSGNTANIGSIKNIADMKSGKGLFADLGEDMFDSYWLNYDNDIVLNENKIKVRKLKDWIDYNLEK